MIASRLARIALWTIVGLLLAALTAWGGVYFWLGSTPGRAQLAAMVPLPPGVEVGAVRWGPAPDAVALGPVVIKGDDGRELVRVDSVGLDVRLGDLLAGDVIVDSAEAEVAHVEATADEDGKIDLVAALHLPPPTVATATATPARTKGRLEVKRLALFVKEVWLDLGGAQAHVRDLRVDGSIIAGGAADAGPSARIQLATGPCHAAWNKARRMVGFDECLLSASVEGRRLEVRSLVLAQGHEEVLAVKGSVVMEAKPRSHWEARGHLGAFEAAAIAGGSFPGGFDFDGLVLDGDGSVLDGALGVLMAPRWVSGPLTADHVALTVDRFHAEPGLLIPSVKATVSGVSAARFEGLGWSFEGLWVPHAEGDLERKLIAAADGWASDWTLPTGAVGPVALRLATQLKLTGGVIQASAETAHGTVEALGNLKSSPLTKRTTFVADLGFAGADGPLAAALAHDLSDEQRAAVGDRVSGSAEVEVQVDREDRFAPWVTTLEWALGRVNGAKLAFNWDGYGWGPIDVNAPPPTPDEETP